MLFWALPIQIKSCLAVAGLRYYLPSSYRCQRCRRRRRRRRRGGLRARRPKNYLSFLITESAPGLLGSKFLFEFLNFSLLGVSQKRTSQQGQKIRPFLFLSDIDNDDEIDDDDSANNDGNKMFFSSNGKQLHFNVTFTR